MYLGGAVNYRIVMVEHKAFVFHISFHSVAVSDRANDKCFLRSKTGVDLGMPNAAHVSFTRHAFGGSSLRSRKVTVGVKMVRSERSTVSVSPWFKSSHASRLPP